MHRMLLAIVYSLIMICNVISATPTEYFVTLDNRGVVAYFFDLSTGEKSITPLPVKAFDLEGIPTQDAFIALTGSEYDYDKEIYHYEAAVINKEGDLVRTLPNVIKNTFVHHPSQKIFFYFSGYSTSHGKIATAINSYDYEKDILKTVDIEKTGFFTVKNYLNYNPNEDFLYFQNNKGLVYKIDVYKMEEVLTSAKGCFFNDSGSSSVKKTEDDVLFYQGEEIVLKIKISDLRVEWPFSVEFLWLNDDILILSIGGRQYKCSVSKKTYSELEERIPRGLFHNKTKTFYRAVEEDGNRLLKSEKVSLHIQ